MNIAYRLIWNATLNAWVVASELAMGRKKGASASRSKLCVAKGMRASSVQNLLMVAAVAALLLAGAPGSAIAGNGIFINDGTDGGCQLIADQGTGQLQSVSGANCSATDALTQTTRALFYGPANSSGANSLSLGGMLSVNSGRLFLNDKGNPTNGMMIGNNYTYALGADSIAIGNDAASYGEKAIALGAGATVTPGVAPGAIAIGANALTSDSGPLGGAGFWLGMGTPAGQTNRINSTRMASTVIGSGASDADGSGGTALGDHATTSGTQSVAVGGYSKADGGGSAFGTGATATGKWSSAVGINTWATGMRASALGVDANASGEGASALGHGATSTGLESLAVGSNTTASAMAASAVGPSARATDIGALAVGADSVASAQTASAFGTGATAVGISSVAVGSGSTAAAHSALALGDSAQASSIGGVALGYGSVAARTGMNGAKELFSNTAVSSTMGAVSVGSANNERQISNVAGGTQLTDAVNVRQLNAVAQTASTGWNLTAQGANATNVAPGETVDLKNTDGNLVVAKTTADDNVTFNLAKNIKVDSVTMGGTVRATDGWRWSARAPPVATTIGAFARASRLSRAGGLSTDCLSHNPSLCKRSLETMVIAKLPSKQFRPFGLF